MEANKMEAKRPLGGSAATAGRPAPSPRKRARPAQRAVVSSDEEDGAAVAATVPAAAGLPVAAAGVPVAAVLMAAGGSTATPAAAAAESAVVVVAPAAAGSAAAAAAAAAEPATGKQAAEAGRRAPADLSPVAVPAAQPAAAGGGGGAAGGSEMVFQPQAMREGFDRKGLQTDELAPAYMAAVMEYLTAEIVEAAGNAAQKRGSKIDDRDVKAGMADDAELNVVKDRCQLYAKWRRKQRWGDAGD